MSSKLTKRKSGVSDDAAPASDTDATKARYTKMIEEASAKAPPKFQPYVKQAAPFVATAIVGFQIALPYVIQFITLVQGFVAKLPENVIFASVGFLICFFGGVFPATIAAFEAWSLCGGNEAIACCKAIFKELKAGQEASEQDDKKDDDNDGKADVDQLSGKALLARKADVALKTLDPNTVSTAVSSIYTGWIGVMAALRIQFARTVTLANVVGEKMYLVTKMAEPSIEAVVPEEYHKWVPTLLQWTCKAIAISIAWWVQRVISAIHSAIRGGLMFSKYLCEVLKEKGVDIPYEEYIIGWAVAGCGLCFQIACGFGVPFPLNLILWPLNVVEWFIIYNVSSGSGSNF